MPSPHAEAQLTAAGQPTAGLAELLKAFVVRLRHTVPAPSMASAADAHPPPPAAAPRVAQERGWVNEFLAKERLEVELLQAAGVVTDAPSYNKRVIKLNTALLYAPPPAEPRLPAGP